MEGYETEINELKSFLSSLEGYNQHICNSSESFSEYISAFHSYIPNLISLSQSFEKIFEQPDSDEKTASEFVGASKTSKYNYFANKISKIIMRSVSKIVADDFTTNQIQRIREIFLWFSDISKTFYEFNPKPGFIMSKPSAKFHEKLDQQFSKIVIELAKSLDSEPTDLQALNILPSSFPHHIVAFSNLLCRAIDIQKHLIIAEFSIRAKIQNSTIKLQFPTPEMLQNNETFRNLILLQNKILDQIRTERTELSHLYESLKKSKTEFFEARSWITNVIQTGFINKREDNISILEDMVQCETRYKTFLTAKILCNKNKKFDTSVSFESEIYQEDHKLNLSFPPDSISDIIKSQLMSLKNIKERMTLSLINCENYLDTQGKRMKEYAIQTFVPNEKRRSDLYQFRQIIDSIRKSGTLSIQAVSNFSKIEESDKLVSDIIENFFTKSAVLHYFPYIPTFQNLTEIEEALNNTIKENEDMAKSLLQEILDNRQEADLLNAVNETIKYKKANQSKICHKCQTERSYVLLTCGHTFCEDCYQRLIEDQVDRCPYHSCEMPFTPDDFCPILWDE